MILIDTNIISDILTEDKRWGEKSFQLLIKHFMHEELCINPIIYAELSVAFTDANELNQSLHMFKKLPLDYEISFRAARAFREYRRNGGKREKTLPDFFIGAHAEERNLKLITRDKGNYHTYFPNVILIYPE